MSLHKTTKDHVNGLIVITLIGGQVQPVSVESVEDVCLLWKNVQKKAEKKQISLVINRSIPSADTGVGAAIAAGSQLTSSS